MFRQVLYVHWKWAQWGLAAACIIAFVVPVAALAGLGGRDLALVPVYAVVNAMQGAGFGYTACAILAGLWIAGSAWSTDLQLDYVYALTRPVPRWYFVLLRFGSGTILVGAVVIACLAGALVVTLIARLPATLHAYPAALTLRFALAAGASYAGAFGVFGTASKAVSRTTAMVLIGVMGVIALDATLFGAALSKAVGSWLVGPWSPLGMFFGRWMLIDV